MTISCAIEWDGKAWWWSTDMRLLSYDMRPHPPSRFRAKQCCSCGDLVLRSAKYIQVERWRDCANEIEERICGDEVPLASWFVCESCAPIFVKLHDMNVDVDLGNCNFHDLLGEFEALYGPSVGFKLKLPTYQSGGIWV
ncbi:hypothetical protein HAQ01_11190 [Acidithiobacillus thiooxidans]|uniref:hypothetical protein n=1 Tax=Acidithiobacillus thiooxidans TaxID=930 RepID=UPI0002625312|nr:hypothetical protein [Acidithiobacillus thiooxidans]MBU2793945.1 hypothetical protein [Acidithiobacillus thiooxidans]